MSQLFLSTTPDTSSLAICSLIITYILFLVSLQKKRLYIVLWVLAGIFSLSVTTTNLIQTFICFIVIIVVLTKDNRVNFSYVSLISVFVTIVVLTTVFLSILQKAIYPSSTLFFMPWAYGEDFSYASLLVIRQPLIVVAQIIKHFFLVNFIAPSPDVFLMSGKINPAVTFSSSWSYTFIGWLGTILWLCLLIIGIVKSFFIKQKNLFFFIGISSCLAFNIVLHSIYGIVEIGKIELFIYTGNFTFLVLLFLSNYSISNKVFIKILLGLLAILIGLNNLTVMSEILAIYN